jgi:hypothetical protein
VPSRTGHTFQAHQAHALAGRAAGQVALDHGGSGVAAGARSAGAAHLLDGPGQAGFDRAGGGVDVVAVQAQAGFQAQRVACAQAGRLDFGLGQQGFGQRHAHVRLGTEISKPSSPV